MEVLNKGHPIRGWPERRNCGGRLSGVSDTWFDLAKAADGSGAVDTKASEAVKNGYLIHSGRDDPRIISPDVETGGTSGRDAGDGARPYIARGSPARHHLPGREPEVPYLLWTTIVHTGEGRAGSGGDGDRIHTSGVGVAWITE